MPLPNAKHLVCSTVLVCKLMYISTHLPIFLVHQLALLLLVLILSALQAGTNKARVSLSRIPPFTSCIHVHPIDGAMLVCTLWVVEWSALSASYCAMQRGFSCALKSSRWLNISTFKPYPPCSWTVQLLLRRNTHLAVLSSVGSAIKKGEYSESWVTA